jgi:cysteine desulfurase
MEPFLFDRPGNPHAADHAFGWEADGAVAEARDLTASAIGADESDVIFTSGATEANNLALLGLAARAPKGRRTILVGSTEHPSVSEAAAAAARRFAMNVVSVPVNSQGIVDLGRLEQLLTERVLVVCVMAVNNEVGALAPLSDVVRAAHAVGALVHCDATHSLVAAPFDFGELDLDLASFSAHKAYGPKGVGALVARREVQASIEPLIYGGGQQAGLRPGTLPVPLLVGMATAFNLLNGDESAAERARIASLRDALFEALVSSQFGAQLVGPSLNHRHPGNLSIRIPSVDSHHLIGLLQPRVAISTGSACSSGSIHPSHVLRAMGLSDEQALETMRIGIGRFTSSEEIAYAAEEITAALRSISTA